MCVSVCLLPRVLPQGATLRPTRCTRGFSGTEKSFKRRFLTNHPAFCLNIPPKHSSSRYPAFAPQIPAQPNTYRHWSRKQILIYFRGAHERGKGGGEGNFLCLPLLPSFLSLPTFPRACAPRGNGLRGIAG